MVRRVVENVVVAVVASAVTWALSNPGQSAAVTDAIIKRLLSGVASYGGPPDSWLWLAAVALVVVGIALQIVTMAPLHNRPSWEWSLSMPSMPTTLMGFGVAVGLIAKAISFAQSTSRWTLPLLVLVVYWGYRWMAGIRYRWTRMERVL